MQAPPWPRHVHMFSSLPPPYGGVSVWTDWFTQAARASGAEIRVQTMGPRHSGSTLAPLSRLSRLGRGLLAPAWSLARGAAGRANVVHICVSGGASFWRGLFLARFAAKRRQRCVVHLHSRAHTCAPAALRWAERLVQRNGVLLVTPSAEDAQRNTFMQHIAHFIPADHGAGATWRGLGPQGLRLLYLGWMIEAKGIFDLLPALVDNPGVRLDAYGPNVQPRDLRRWQRTVRQLGLKDRVHYGGVLEHHRVAARLVEYDALVAPSHDESFGLATAEAMHLGVPVLGSPVGLLWNAPEDSFVPISAATLEATLTRLCAARQSLVPVGRRGAAHVQETLCPSRSMAAWRRLYQDT